MAKKTKKGILVKYKNNLIYHIFSYIIDGADLKLNNSKENIFKIKSGNTTISTPEIKYY